MKSILVSSRRVLSISLIASAVALLPASAHASLSPTPWTPPSMTSVDLGTTLDLVIAAYGL